MKSKFSIIVPVFNVERYLDACVNSIISQTYENFELLLVDDGSNDTSGEICKKWASIDSRIRFLKINNNGPNIARNHGLINCSGSFILFVDADDWLDSSTLEILSRYLQSYDSDMVVFGYDFIDNFGVVIEKKSFPLQSFLGEQIFTESLKGIKIAGVCWNKCYKKSILFDHSLQFTPDMMHGRDIIFTRQFASLSKFALIIPEILYHSRFRQNSFSRSFNSSNMFSGLDFAKKHEELFLDGVGCFSKMQVNYSIGKHLRYLLLMSAFRSLKYVEHKENFRIVKQSRFWIYVRPNLDMIQLYTFRDFILSFISLSAFFGRTLALISKRFGFEPY